ncbi:MAG: carboxypeptidase-like regulatory domain-containing protein [Bacteroidota bacterium]
MRCIISGFLLIINSGFLLSQHTISGKVVDAETKEGLIGAHIYVVDDWRNGAITGLEGRFSLQLEKEYLNDSLIISYVGYKEQLVPISSDLVIKLEMIEQQGETIVVTAKPLISEEFKYLDIDKMEIYTNPAAKADPLLAVNALPSSTTVDESANISLRGSRPIETGIYFNNVPIYDAVRYSQLNGIGTFSIFNTEIIESVTVFPGNPPLEFGNASSGIISMKTDDKVVKESSNSVILSLANIGFSRQQKVNDKTSMKLFSNWQPSRPIKWLNKEALMEIESFTSNDIGVYLYGNNPQYSWKILAYGVTEGYQFNFQHPSFKGIFDQEKDRGFLISTVEKKWGPGTVTFNNGLSFSNGKYGYSNVDFNTEKRDFFIGLNYLVVKEKFSLKSGFSFDDRYSAVTGNFHLLEYALGLDHPTVDLNEDTRIKVPEFFGYFKYYLSDQIAFGTGLRKNISSGNVSDYLSHQANLLFSEGNWTITGGIGKYHKNGFQENTGEPFSTRNVQKSLDVKRNSKGLQLSVSIFDKKGSVNGADYTSKGAEIFANYQLHSNLRTSASITLLDVDSEQDENIFDLSYFIRGNVSWNLAKFWTIESIWTARQGTLTSVVSFANYDANLEVYRPNHQENSIRLPYYLNVGLSVNRVLEISDQIGVIAFASLNNVLNRKNIREYTYNSDYSQRDARFFSLRTGYMGIVINF